MSGTQGVPALTVCVIGRNESRHLAAGAASLAFLAAAGIRFESIYVDSASSDDSVRLARELFDTVIVLGPHPSLNAGAARHVGTGAARGDWVLYLDGDMELLEDMIAPIAALVRGGDLHQGLCGYTVNHFSNGERSRIVYAGNKDGEPCRGFGGAVLLPRAALLAAGNWPLALFSYEEAELHSRLEQTRVRVIWHERDFVKHTTPWVSNLTKLTGLMWPVSSYLGKKFYGPGQVTRLTLAHGNFLQFARIRPWGYLIIAALAASLLALPFTRLGALIFPTVALAMILARGLKFFLVHCAWIPQVGLGLHKLDCSFAPRIDSITDDQTRDARIGGRRLG